MTNFARFPYGLTAHAALMLTERGISQEWLIRVLVNTQKTELDQHDPALRHALGRKQNAKIECCGSHIITPLKPWRIVTAYFDRTQRNRL